MACATASQPAQQNLAPPGDGRPQWKQEFIGHWILAAPCDPALTCINSGSLPGAKVKAMRPLRHFRHVTAAAAALLLAACGTLQAGRDFDLPAFQARVQRGVSTQAEVRAWLGAPNGTGVSVETGGERFEQWNYFHGTAPAQGTEPARLKLLQVKFDAQGVVRAYNWSGER
jgi:hypothetical protein